MKEKECLRCFSSAYLISGNLKKNRVKCVVDNNLCHKVLFFKQCFRFLRVIFCSSHLQLTVFSSLL